MQTLNEWIQEYWGVASIMLLVIMAFIFEQLALRMLFVYFKKSDRTDENGNPTRPYRFWRRTIRITIGLFVMAISLMILQYEGLRFIIHDNVLIVSVLMIIIMGITLSRVVPYLIKEFFDHSAELIHVDPTQYKFFRHTVQGLIVLGTLVLIILQIPQLKNLAYTLFAGAGVLALVLGLASQQAFSNIVSGIFIVIFRPFRVGDTINIATQVTGVVEDITLRHTVIRDFENRRVIIPNSSISTQTITNFHITDEKVCRFLELSLGLEVDLRKAIQILKEATMAHPDFLDNRSDEEKAKNEDPVNVRVLGYTDAGARVRVYVWGKNPGTSFSTMCDLNLIFKEKLAEAGIPLSYPHRIIQNVNPAQAGSDGD